MRFNIEKDINKFTVTLYKIAQQSGNGDVTEIGAADESDFKYTVLDDGTAEITKYTGNATKLKIPSKLGGYTVTSIGLTAFAYCTSLKSITIPASVSYIGRYAFDNCRLLTSISVSNTNNKYCDINGVLFNKNKTELIQYPIGNTKETYSIPNSVNIIGVKAFEGCKSLTSVTIPNSVTSICGYAFKDCVSLISITIPNGVTSIGYVAFYNCSSLKSVMIAKSVKSIASGAFSYCSSLKNMYYEGTKEQWDSIDIFSTFDEFSNFTIHYNSLNKFKAKTYLANNSDDNKIEYKTLSKTGLVPNQVYVLMIIAGGADDYSIDTSSLKYITDEVADENGNVNFKYRYNGDDEIIAVVFGACNHILDDWQIVKEPTCKTEGKKVQYCKKCYELVNIQAISKTEHKWNKTYTVDVKATDKTAGSKSIHCSICNAKKPGSDVVIPSTGSNANVNKPSNSNVANQNKTVNNQNQSAAKKLTLKLPKVKLISGKKQFKVKYTKVKDAVGFKIRYKIKGKWIVKTFNTKKSVTKVIKGLKKGKYKVQIRAFSKGKKSYSKWTKVKTVKVK